MGKYDELIEKYRVIKVGPYVVSCLVCGVFSLAKVKEDEDVPFLWCPSCQEKTEHVKIEGSSYTQKTREGRVWHLSET